MQSPVARQDPANSAFQLAADFVLHTSKSVFLTGKAGTGKTTFLKYISSTTTKKTAVAAPTGVAAINAGGMTMHSLFQLPFGLFIPGHTAYDSQVQVTNRNTLFKNLRLSKNKRELLQELELLIIDEVSMVRCDMLDATDAILRYVRRSQLPFGGVQVLYIGDLFQLPPVAVNEEWAILNDHYESPFFFHANVILQSPPLCLELKKIYRQNEAAYIDLLNHVRNNEVTQDDLTLLNSRYSPDAGNLRDHITLTTHNYKADAINREELKRLPGPLFNYIGVVEGDFNEKNSPADQSLQLKKGAKVMFIRNDSGDERSYYNGKLATVSSLSAEKITVTFDDTGSSYELKRETWRNIRYNYNREDDSVEEEVLGSFSQFPIRLAWAITIHKSQGLTFERVVVDAGDSFAAGQVYVALSRCTSLSGLVLRSHISFQQISTDERVLQHARQLQNEMDLSGVLQAERQQYEHDQLVSTFDVDKIHRALGEWLEELPGKKLPDIQKAMTLAQNLVAKLAELTEVAKKFRPKLDELLADARLSHNYDLVYERAGKAVHYFNDFLEKEVLSGLREHIKELQGKAKVKKYLTDVKALALLISKKGEKIRGASLNNQRFFQGEVVKEDEVTLAPVKVKREKGQSALESLQLLRQGNDVVKIADIRGLAKTTIEGHLADYILTGEVEVTQLVPEQKLLVILKTLEEMTDTPMGQVKQRLGDDFSYGEIRAVVNYRERQKKS